MGKALEFKDDGKVLLNGRELRARYFDEPMQDGTTCIVEATSNVADRYQEKLMPKELRGVQGKDLPLGFEISIYRPIARTTGLDQLSVRNLSSGPELTFCVNYGFSDWSHRNNLIHFAEDLRSLVELKMPKCASARAIRDHYGVDIWCDIGLEEDDDIFEVFAMADRKMTNLYGEAIAEAERPFVTLLEAANRGNESELKWWVRYVMVPLLSGGAGAAVIGWYLLGP